jgi:hypothetical protein
MLHNNIFRAIEEMESRVDIEDEIDWHNAFEKAFGLYIPMPLDDSIMVIHTRSNPLILKIEKVVCSWVSISKTLQWFTIT